MDSMYRKAAYQASITKKLGEIGGQIQLKLKSDEPLSSEDYSGFAEKYEEAGGKLENFNKYWVSQLRAYDQPQLQKFKEELQSDSALQRLQNRMQLN